MPDDVLLRADHLTKSFAGFIAVKDVSLDVKRGSVHALIGPNGAGKTTFFNLLTRMLRVTSGRILYNGRDITALEPHDVAALGIVRSFQISATFPHLTARENVRIALQRFRGDSYAFWRSDSVLHELDDRAEALLAEVGLEGFADRLAAELPYGRKRALELATTLALEPELLLLDEPTAGMAHEEIGRIVSLIRQVAANRTIIMVEHNLSVVADLSHRITVMQRGEIVTLVGRNGAGKTTTLRAIMGILRRRRGSLRVAGVETVGLPPEKIARLGIGYVPEERGIFASLNVIENLMLPPRLKAGGMSLDEIYALFPNLKERSQSNGAKLSGGEQQMLAVARVLRTGADFLVLDEPTEGLAPVIVAQIGIALDAIRRRGMTVLLVEQNFRFAAGVSDRHYVMETGRIVDMVPRAELGGSLARLEAYLGV